jgi:hypothetical protein
VVFLPRKNHLFITHQQKKPIFINKEIISN